MATVMAMPIYAPWRQALLTVDLSRAPQTRLYFPCEAREKVQAQCDDITAPRYRQLPSNRTLWMQCHVGSGDQTRSQQES